MLPPHTTFSVLYLIARPWYDRPNLSREGEVPDLGFVVPFHPYPVAMPDPDLAVAFAQAAEELGFDSLWVGDHILWRTPLLEPLTLLAALATRTTRIKLGTGVLLLPLRQ